MPGKKERVGKRRRCGLEIYLPPIPILLLSPDRFYISSFQRPFLDAAGQNQVYLYRSGRKGGIRQFWSKWHIDLRLSLFFGESLLPFYLSKGGGAKRRKRRRKEKSRQVEVASKRKERKKEKKTRRIIGMISLQGEKRRLCPRLNVGLRLFLAQLVVLAHLVPGVSTQLSWQEERVACWLGCRRVFMLNIQ